MNRQALHLTIDRPDAHARPLHAARGRRWWILLVQSIFTALASTLLSADATAQAPTSELQPGQFVWTPEIAPRGPLVVVVSLPLQRAYVYRNGVRIGISTVSTGRTGYETPGGVFTILQKHREHYSNLYENASMPFMQRLTWDGLALHAGKLPGYPASHGCVRLPSAFAEHLFSVTAAGTIVVIAAQDSFPPTVTSPGLFAPVDSTTGAALQAPMVDATSFEWVPKRAPSGPLTIVLSTGDQRVVVLRNGVEIGHSPISVRDSLIVATQAYVLLEGTEPEPSLVVPDRPALRWMVLTLPSDSRPTQDLRQAIMAGSLSVPREFARLIYDVLTPGDTVVVTDEPLQPAAAAMTLMSSYERSGAQ